MKIAIIGSRTFTDYTLLCKTLDTCGLTITEIISGGANGADSLGARYAKENNIPLKEFIPNWSKYGKSAGFKRNGDIVSAADVVYAFWDGNSRGTHDSIRKAQGLGKKVQIVRF